MQQHVGNKTAISRSIVTTSKYYSSDPTHVALDSPVPWEQEGKGYFA